MRFTAGFLAGLVTSGSLTTVQAQENTIDTISKNTVSIKEQYSQRELNQRTYEQGLESTFSAELDLPVKPGISLHHNAYFSFLLSELLEEDALRTRTDLRYSLQGRFPLFASEELRIFAGLGPAYRRIHDQVELSGLKAEERQLSVGGEAAFWLYSNPFDLKLVGSYQIGEEEASLDPARRMQRANVTLCLIPKAGMFTFKHCGEYDLQLLLEDPNDRKNYRLAVDFEPGFTITEHWQVHGSSEIAYTRGEDISFYFKVGGGAGYVW